MGRMAPMSDDNYDRLREFMRTRRLAMGMYQSEVGPRMGRPRNYGGLLESGSPLANRPSLPIVWEWARVLRLQPSAQLILNAPELREPLVLDLMEGMQ